MGTLITATALASGSLITTGVQAYFAPVDRTNAITTPFDAGLMGRFATNIPPPGWGHAGLVRNFKRLPASTITPLWSGTPATVKTQVRAAIGEEVEFEFPAWNRLSMELSAGTQTLNLLQSADGASAGPSGGAALPAEALLSGSTAMELQLKPATLVQPGDVVVVDEDYAGQTGYLGSGAPGAFLSSIPTKADVDMIRRVSFNVARVLTVSQGVATLASSLPAGVPTASMKLNRVNGFVNREGGSFVPEWSALFVLDGLQGDRLLLHFPRLQPVGSHSSEAGVGLAKGLERWRPTARLRALPVLDPNGSTPSVCFRSYLPAPLRLV